jgi:cytochrome P450
MAALTQAARPLAPTDPAATRERSRPATIGPNDLPRHEPAAKGLSAWALLRALRRDPLTTFTAEAYTELRPRLRFFGRDYVLLNDLADIDHVLNKNMAAYRRDILAQRLLEPVVGRGMVLAEGEAWREQRRSLVPAFQPRHIDRLIPLFHDEVARRVAAWSGDTGERNLLDDFRRLTLALAGRAMFSIEDDVRTAELAELARENADTSLLGWRDHIAALLWSGIPQAPERRAFRAQWRAWAASFLDHRPPIADLDQAHDLLDLLRASRDATGASLPREVIIDQIGTMMAAGFGTTAVTLFWVALLLAVFPAQQEAVRGELCPDGAEAPPDAAFLRSARTTTMFVYEALRLYPPVYAISRRAASDDRVGDVPIRRGTVVTVAPWVLHRHAAHWRDPHQFNPSRFLQNGRIVVPKAWIPFGTGPRVCIGAAFATTEMLVVLRALLGRYRIELRGAIPRPVGKLVLLPEFEPRFDLVPR